METCHCADQLGAVLDLATPQNVALSAYFKRSFANYTVKVRMPVILTQIIDTLVRSKEEILQEYGVESIDELKGIIGKISKLKYEIQTNKPITKLQSKGFDTEEYNLHMKNEIDKSPQCTYYSTTWLFVECYMYKRLSEIFLFTKTLSNYDYFAKQKHEAFESSLEFIVPLAINLLNFNSSERSIQSKEELKDDFCKLLKINLWGNKCDLSLSLGKQSASADGLLDRLDQMDKYILCDQSAEAFECVCRSTMCEIIDIVCDNAGYEIFTDLCLADFLITHEFAQHVRFHVKSIPWFISDVMKDDFHWILEQLCNADDESLQHLGNRWKKYIDSKTWTIEESIYWTSPLDFAAMFEKDNALFRKLARAKCTFYKGDLNYRKLLGDINWNPTTPFEEALRGFFASKLCAIRTCKSDIICGLEAGVAEQAETESKEWLINGNYGVIQFCGKTKKLF